MNYVFVSPHLDDAVLSAGDMIAELKRKGKRVEIITVFTDFGREPIHWNARKYVWDSGCLTLSQFQNMRLREDEKAIKRLDAEWLHLGFTDAYFRKQNNKYIYRNSRELFSASIDMADKKLIGEISAALRKLIASGDIVFGPLGVGGHVDHIIVKQAIDRLQRFKKYFWLDLPYAVKPEFNGNLEKIKRGYRLKFQPKITKIKYLALKQYRSQSSCREAIAIKPREEIYENINRHA